MTSVDLLHLPDEILLLCFDAPDLVQEIYGLALSCRRLHHIFLPIYLDRHGIKNPNAQASITISDGCGTIDGLSGLRIATFLQRTEHLSFWCSPSWDDTPLKATISHLDRLCHLVERLSHIGSLTIFIGKLPSISDKSQLGVLGGYLERIVGAANRKGCSAIALRGRAVLEGPSSSSTPSIVTRCIAAASKQLKQVIPGAGWGRVFSLGKLRKSPAGRPLTTTLTLDHLLCSSPALLPSLRYILQQTAVAHLRIENVDFSGATTRHLDTIARYAQDVRSLTFSRCVMTWDQATEFVCSFTSLSSLNLDDTNTLTGLVNLKATSGLRALISLRCSPCFIDVLLQRGFTFPKLATLSLHTITPSLRHLDMELSHIHERFRSKEKPLPTMAMECVYDIGRSFKDDVLEYTMQGKEAEGLRRISSILIELSLLSAPAHQQVAEDVWEWLQLFDQAHHLGLKLHCLQSEAASVVADAIKKLAPLARVTFTI